MNGSPRPVDAGVLRRRGTPSAARTAPTHLRPAASASRAPARSLPASRTRRSAPRTSSRADRPARSDGCTRCPSSRTRRSRLPRTVLMPARLQIGRPFLDDRRGVTIMKAAADRRIAVADDLHVAVERSAGIDVAAHVDGRRDFEVGLSRSIAAAVVKSFMFDAGASGRCGIALRDDAAAVDLDDLDAGVGARETLPLTRESRRSSSVRAGGRLERRAAARGACAARASTAFRLLRRRRDVDADEKRDQENDAETTPIRTHRPDRHR